MIAIIYLGKRGGGEKLLRDLSKSNKIDFSRVTFFVSEAILSRFTPPPNASVVGIKTFNNPIGSILYFHRIAKAILIIKKELKQNRIQRVLFLMPHPWDLLISLAINRKYVDVFTCIHDLEPHPGEFFPPKNFTRLLIAFSSCVITFSKYIQNQIPMNKQSILSRLPQNREAINYPPGITHDILFIGRFHAYKGLSNLPKISEEIYKIGRTLSIVGSGKFLDHNPQNSFLKIGWIENEEFMAHIAQAKLIILPYIEASQSGIASIAVSHQVPIVVMPVGGLQELVSDWDCGEVSADLSVEKFVEAIKVALSKKYTFVQRANFHIPDFDEVVHEIGRLSR
jgi:glycosyltransferase involved in cell wall biosynthesis